MDVIWFWILVALLLVVIFAWPSWPYMRQRGIYRRGGAWRYGASALAFLGIIILLALFWVGLLVIWWPWAAY